MQEADGSNPLFSTHRDIDCGTVFDILAQAKQALLPCVYVREVQNKEKESKGAWWMPRLTEAKKDVVSCEKPRVGANGL